MPSDPPAKARRTIDTFDRAIVDFAVAYADQSERDHDELMKAVRAGKLEVFVEEKPWFGTQRLTPCPGAPGRDPTAGHWIKTILSLVQRQCAPWTHK
jgi:hypothetical protein